MSRPPSVPGRRNCDIPSPHDYSNFSPRTRKALRKELAERIWIIRILPHLLTGGHWLILAFSRGTGVFPSKCRSPCSNVVTVLCRVNCCWPFGFAGIVIQPDSPRCGSVCLWIDQATMAKDIPRAEWCLILTCQSLSVGSRSFTSGPTGETFLRAGTCRISPTCRQGI